MPNLALFANAGFPFTKYADLAETTVVLPDQPSADDAEAMLFMLGRFGRMTGIPALRYQLVASASATSLKNTDLLVIGGPAGKDLLSQWGRDLPAIIEQNHRTLTPLAQLRSVPADLLGDERGRLKSSWKVDLNAEGPLAALLGFESPLKSGRSVIAIAASGSGAAAKVIDAIEDEGLVSRIRGDVAFVRERQINSFEVNGTYFVGFLPWHLRIWFFLSQHPVLLAVFGVLAGLMLAFLCYWTLKGVAARRISQ
jgi:hypothetical protein